MSDKKFEFTEQEREIIFFDLRTNGVSVIEWRNNVIDLIERLISSRSASPQQGAEGAEEVLDKVCKSVPYIWGSNAEQSELLLPKKLALQAMHQFAQSQVEQAVKEKDVILNALEANISYLKECIDSWVSHASDLSGDKDELKNQITQLEHALKVQTEHVADLMAASAEESKVRQLFKSSTAENDDGWMMCSCGNSNIDGEDYVVTTNRLHSTDVPSECCDAKDFSALVADLLNHYYSK